jgi:hypothetical protein
VFDQVSWTWGEEQSGWESSNPQDMCYLDVLLIWHVDDGPWITAGPRNTLTVVIVRYM